MTSFDLRRRIADAGPMKLPEVPDLTLNLNPPRKMIITGGPWSGKTTTVKALFVATGIRGVPEPAALLIRSAKRASDVTADQIRSGEGGKEIDFTEKVLQRRLASEQKLRPDTSYFLDRGLLDSKPYLIIDEAPLDVFEQLSLRARYDLVFFLDPLPGIAAGGTRNDYDVRNQAQLARLTYETYCDFGYDVVQVPVMSIADRVRAITSACAQRFCC